MTSEWLTQETTTHQDHVIAHVLGATVEGYFILDETLFIVLDIGFIWKIYLNAEMVLLPHPVAVSELEVDPDTKAQIGNEIDRLLAAEKFQPRDVSIPPTQCLIEDVTLYQNDGQLRIVLTGEEGSLAIETLAEGNRFKLEVV